MVPGQPLALRVAVGDLPHGVYTVSWRTVSRVDGHLATGTFSFGVGVAPKPGGTSTRSPTPSVPSVIARWLLYVGLMVLVGSVLLVLVGHTGIPSRVALPVGAGCVLALAGAVGIAQDAAHAAHLGIGDLPGTSIARQLVLRVIPLIVAAVAAFAAFALPVADRHRRRLLLLVAAAGLAAMWADVTASHVSGAHSWRYERMAVQWAHFVAAGIWVGGLLALLATLGLAEDRSLLARRFSAMALGAVAVIAATGVQRAYDEVGTVHRLVATGFGQSVLVKSGLLCVMVVLGAFNRFRSVPIVARVVAPLRRAVSGEVVLAAGVLAATGVLQGLAPPSSVPEPPKPLVVHAIDFGTTVRATLSVTPATVGFNRFTLTVVDYDTRRPVAGTASLRFALPARAELAPSTLALSRSAPGRFAGDGANLSLAGTWTVTADIQLPTGGIEVTFPVATRTPAERITVQHNRGLPDVYTLQLPQQQSLQVYLDPGRRGFNEFHMTFVGANGQEVQMAGTTVLADPGGALPVRRLDPIGHFVADLAGALPRAYRFTVTGDTASGAEFQGRFTITVH